MQSAAAIVHSSRGNSFAPRKVLTVSQWADAERHLSKKGSAEPGPWRTDRNPPLREPMDCLSVRSPVRCMVVMFPIQFGKTEIEVNALGYFMSEAPGPIMVCLPGEVSQKKWINQKLNPMVEKCAVVRESLVSVNSRDSSNTKDFKDFLGGQLYIEHAGSPARLKSTSVKYLLVDELTEFSNALTTGDDPLVMLQDRVSAFPATSKECYISSPGVKGICRTTELYEQSDQRKYYMPCPHCLEMITFEWAGLRWDTNGQNVRFGCPECGCEIEEHQKTDMIKQGRWIAENPGAKIRGYTINCLYYQIGLGPRWETLVDMFLKAQSDPARLKTFINSRLAEAWEDPSMRAVKLNVIADRAESYPLRIAPIGVCMITAGVDTQDDRLECQIIGWGKHMAIWVIDYVVLLGDPADDAVWLALEDLLNTPIEHANGHYLAVQSTAIDAGGHRTQAVYDFVRRRRIKRPLAIFGAKPNNAPVLSKPKAQDVNWKGREDKRGVYIQHVGTVGIKNKLFGRMSTDGDKPQDKRMLRFSDQLPAEYFAGVVSETFNPRTNRFEKKRGARNEPLDTLVYAYAAAHHAELRLHMYTQAKWDELLIKYGYVKDNSAREQPEKIVIEPVKSTKPPKRNSQLL
jgi:phage terminase large subunit GpA-like protein